MSEHQDYEFHAIDQPLDATDQRALRALSSRARISSTSFINTYQWGDFKGNPTELMRRWFDVHIYLANWGTRRLMLRVPSRLVDRHRFSRLLEQIECAEMTEAGENLVLDIQRDEVASDDWEEDGSGWLAALAPLRNDLLQGDLRLFHLLWLTSVEAGNVVEATPEPVPGIGPMTAALQAFADFFGIDGDLVEAAAERSDVAVEIGRDAARARVAAMAEHEKTDLLLRLADGDPHVGAELRASIRRQAELGAGVPPATVRTAGELLARAQELQALRERREAERVAAERQRQAEAAERARRARLDELRRKGDRVWDDVEAEIERRNASAYDRAASLLLDLRALAESGGRLRDFSERLTTLRERHARKERFVARLVAMQ